LRCNFDSFWDPHCRVAIPLVPDPLTAAKVVCHTQPVGVLWRRADKSQPPAVLRMLTEFQRGDQERMQDCKSFLQLFHHLVQLKNAGNGVISALDCIFWALQNQAAKSGCETHLSSFRPVMAHDRGSLVKFTVAGPAALVELKMNLSFVHHDRTGSTRKCPIEGPHRRMLAFGRSLGCTVSSHLSGTWCATAWPKASIAASVLPWRTTLDRCQWLRV